MIDQIEILVYKYHPFQSSRGCFLRTFHEEAVMQFDTDHCTDQLASRLRFRLATV